MISNQLKLFQIAPETRGFFSSKDAVRSGFALQNHSYFVRTRTWERWGRGIFRLRAYPLPPNPDLYVTAIYLRGRDETQQGVFALESAAAIHEIGDFMPEKHFIAAIPEFERRLTIDTLKIFRYPLGLPDFVLYEGLPVTTPLQTILDFIRIGCTDRHLVESAYMMARQVGKIRTAEVKRLLQRKDHPPEIAFWERFAK